MPARYMFLKLVFGLVAAIWTLYLFSIQVLNPFDLGARISGRYIPKKEILIPNRGPIYDSAGSLLVSSIRYYQIDIDRAAVERWTRYADISLEHGYQRIADLIHQNSHISAEDVMKRLSSGKKLTSIQIGNKFRELELERIVKAFEAQRLPGLSHSFASMRRIYSKDLVAARVLGSVRAQSEGFDPLTLEKSLYKLAGICGLEATHDRLLAGEYGWREYLEDANHRRVPYPNLQEKRPVNGLGIRLTIDSNIQEVVENALRQGLEKYNALNAGAVVMDPRTGRVIAMAGVSKDDRDIDQNLVRVRANIPSTFMFEPGSTMKPLTMLAAIDCHVVRPDEKIPCGTYQVGRRTISDTHFYGPLQPIDIISKSSNVGVARIAERIGPARLYDKFISYGFGQKTPLNLYGETSGMFAKLANWDGYTLHSISFGQGMSVTALQQAMAFSAIANGGKMMKPMLVDAILDERGRVVEQFEPSVLRQVATKAAADTILTYLQAVVDRGTGRHIKMDYITLGGKTGTAQKNVEGTRGYSSGKYTSVFTGVFPIEDPRMVIVVFYDEPAPGFHYGSTSAAPTFRKIVEDILFMPNCDILAFNERLKQASLTMPDLTGKHLRDAEAILNRYGFLYKIEGADSSSVVVDQFPKANVAVERGHPITVKVGKSAAAKVLPAGMMPDLKGLTLRKALLTASAHKLRLNVRGSGIVRSQSILPGSKIYPGATVIVEASL